ncbi:hypothetical protein OC834_005402 [Tilletia horrida]|uniref:ABC transporter domain-containing protein n=1 Tax=Tilletia horrida TaxID=155126 RepID=A0AAN6G744_9BASI|nr:hypothetical protein OC834_005402 [Tilletia horrida]KAK0525310.1 hypothetical protein OC842_005540 [Tilletia horrida]KAK0525913.1 hypothetical protein OC835_005454 [Tilletia horrida]KAK0557973.1 hypothetical protein OC844_005435 [Tilletia horrida]
MPVAVSTESLLNKAFPTLDDAIVSYLAGFVDEPDESPEQALSTVIEPILESATRYNPAQAKQLKAVLAEIRAVLEEKAPKDDELYQTNTGLTRLDRVVDMSKTAMSKTAGFDTAGGVDLALGGSKKNRTTVDLKKLEKQEAKTRAKLAKRAQRDLYESSKLVEQAKNQASYEELFLKVNPLENAAHRSKNKDVHLPSIDLSFGSNRLLNNATLTLAAGRRYGVIGRNGYGKSTLLRNMAMRELPIPTHISLLYVEQEITGDDTPALEAVLRADVWRERLLAEERSINAQLAALEEAAAAANAANEGEAAAETQEAAGGLVDMPTRQREMKREELTARLGEVQSQLIEMDAESGPARAAALLSGLGISSEQQSWPTKAFSGGWRMRLALARALFCKPDLLMLDEPSNMLDLDAIAWLEDYLVEEWKGTLLLVSHDRAFLDNVATDIIHLHSQRLDYYKGNFTQFYATREERRLNQQREYEANKLKREHLQAFVDRWRYNANRAAQAQSRLKELERLPVLEPPEADDVVTFRLPEVEQLNPPLIQLDDVTFGYNTERILLKNVSVDVTMDSRIAVIGPNGAGKSTLMKLLIGELAPMKGDQKRNGRLRIGWFSQHHVDQLDYKATPVGFLAAKFPGKTEQEYRAHLGAFGITGSTSLQRIETLSGGQKSRVAFAQLSLQRAHILVLDEPTNHLDVEGLDALASAIKKWNGGCIVISHDQTFIKETCNEVIVVRGGKAVRKTFDGNLRAVLFD